MLVKHPPESTAKGKPLIQPAERLTKTLEAAKKARNAKAALDSLASPAKTPEPAAP